MVFGKKRSTKQQTPLVPPPPHRRFSATSMPVLSEDGCEVVPQFFPSGQYLPTTPTVPVCRRAGAIKLTQPVQLDEYGRRCSNASTLSTTSTLYNTHGGNICTRRAGSVVRHDSQEKYLTRRRYTTRSTVTLYRSDSNKTIVISSKPQTAPQPPKVESPNFSDSLMANQVFGRPQTAYLPPREHNLSITN